jgi:hypothetical protein
MIGLKVLFRKSDGHLLGAQAIGEDGPAVDKRISALAVALQMGATVYDLEEAELCYAPQFGSAKDAINFAGMVGADVLRGDMPLVHWSDTQGGFLLDVRQPVELIVERVPDAVNIPLDELRDARTMRRAFSCRTGSRRRIFPAACSRGPYSGRSLAGTGTFWSEPNAGRFNAGPRSGRLSRERRAYDNA